MKADLILPFRSVFIRSIRSIRVQKGRNRNGTRSHLQNQSESLLPAEYAKRREMIFFAR